MTTIKRRLRYFVWEADLSLIEFVIGWFPVFIGLVLVFIHNNGDSFANLSEPDFGFFLIIWGLIQSFFNILPINIHTIRSKTISGIISAFLWVTIFFAFILGKPHGVMSGTTFPLSIIAIWVAFRTIIEYKKRTHKND